MLLICVAVLAAASTTVFAATSLPSGDLGNTQPIRNELTCNGNSGSYVGDKSSLCWYYQCVTKSTGGFELVAKRCSLGTYVYPTFEAATYNPCTERFDINGTYDCTRPTSSATGACSSDVTCMNGGTRQQQGSTCWCDCPADYQGAFDCSQPTVVSGVSGGPRPLGSPCPVKNWCSMSLADGSNPCQNGGTCINQCTNFYCHCPVPYTKDKMCSEFQCSSVNFACPRGLNCTRGLNGKDEFYVCRTTACAEYLETWITY